VQLYVDGAVDRHLELSRARSRLLSSVWGVEDEIRPRKFQIGGPTAPVDGTGNERAERTEEGYAWKPRRADAQGLDAESVKPVSRTNQAKDQHSLRDSVLKLAAAMQYAK